MSDIDLVKLRSSARVHEERYKLVKVISDRISSIPNYETLKTDQYLIEFALELAVAGLHVKMKDKVKIEDIVFDVFVILFPNMQIEEQAALKNSIRFIIENSLVKAVPLIKKAKVSLGKWFHF